MERREYAITIAGELERAEAKRPRLARDLEHTRDAKGREHKQRRLKNLDRQIASLREILAFVGRDGMERGGYR